MFDWIFCESQESVLNFSCCSTLSFLFFSCKNQSQRMYEREYKGMLVLDFSLVLFRVHFDHFQSVLSWPFLIAVMIIVTVRMSIQTSTLIWDSLLRIAVQQVTFEPIIQSQTIFSEIDEYAYLLFLNEITATFHCDIDWCEMLVHGWRSKISLNWAIINRLLYKVQKGFDLFNELNTKRKNRLKQKMERTTINKMYWFSCSF
jgi:hypothetical protein